jgi:hypothetical protein
VYAQWDEDEPFARSARRGASRTVQDAFQISGHWGRSNRTEQASGAGIPQEGSSGEDSDRGHRVGHSLREWRNGQTVTVRPGAPAPGSRRGGAGFFSYPWVYASGLNNRMRTMPAEGEPGPVGQDEAEARARRQHVQVRSRILSDPRFNGSFEEADQVAASIRFGEEMGAMGQAAAEGRPDQLSDNGSGRGDWHDVHEGGAEGQEAPRPGAAFRERRLRRSFGRRHNVSFPLVEALTERAGSNVDAGGEVAGQSNASTQTPRLEGEAGGGSSPLSGEASEGTARDSVRERVRRVQAYTPSAMASDEEEAAEGPLREAPREPVRRIMVYSPEPVVRSRSLREPRRIDGRRRSMDGLPPLPPHRRALSSSPLERRAGLLMLTLASTAAEHPSYSTGNVGGDPRPLLRPPPVGWHRPEEVHADGGLGGADGNDESERVEANLESMGQQLLADYATRFDSRRTLQDVEEGGVGSRQPEGPDEGGVIVSMDDVTSTGPSLSGVQLEDEPVMSEGGVSVAGTGRNAGNEDAGAQGRGDRAPRQSHSLVDSLVSAWRGQRRRPRDVQPGPGDASPSQVRRLRRPEE